MLRRGDDFRDLASIQQSSQTPEETKFPPIRSTTHTKAMLSGNTQKSKHFRLISLSYFPQELVFSPKARPCPHLGNCIINLCLPKGPRILSNTIKSWNLMVPGAISEHGDSVRIIWCSEARQSTSRPRASLKGPVALEIPIQTEKQWNELTSMSIKPMFFSQPTTSPSPKLSNPAL